MLDFFDDLKMCPDSSFEIEKEQDNLMKDFLDTSKNQPFTMEEEIDQIEESFFDED